MALAWSLRIPLRFARAEYRRLVPTVVAIACGVALVCAMDLGARAALRAFTDVMDAAAGRVALEVRAGAGGAFPEEVAATVAAIPGVEIAAPAVSGTAWSADGEEELLTVFAVDVGNQEAVRAYGMEVGDDLRVDDPFALFAQPDSVVLVRSFAEGRALTVGDRIELVTPVGRRPFTVRGLLEPRDAVRAFGGNLVVMDVYAAEMAFTRPGFINRVDVVVRDGQPVARVAEAIARALPPGLHVEAPSQRKVNLERVTAALRVMLRAAGLLGLVAAFLIAFNRLTNVFAERMGQLAVLRAVGVRAGVVWRELLKESLLVGVAGVALGLPLGIGLGRLLLPVIATTTALTYKLPPPEARLSVAAPSLVLAAVLGLGAAFLAAVLPAWRASRLTPRAALAARGVEQQEGARAMWLVRGALAAAIAAAIALQVATRSAAWGLLASVLVTFGTALAARPLVGLSHPALAPALRLVAGPVGRFASTTLLHSPRRTALSAATLGVGLGSILWLCILACSVERSVVDAMASGVRADLVVTASHPSAGYVDVPVHERLLDELRVVPGVMAVSGQRMLDWQHAGAPIAIDALDPDPRGDSGSSPPRPASLLDDAVARGEAVNVSTNFVLHRGARVGEMIALETPTGPLPVRIAGLTTEVLSPGGTVQMSRSLYARHWHDDKVTVAYVWARPEADVATVRTAIVRALGGRHLRILMWAEFIDYCAAQVRRAFAGVRALTALVLLVVLIGTADTLMAGVAERTREVGAMRALGLRRRHIVRMVLLEGVVLATLGLFLALAAGFTLGTLWVNATFPHLVGWVLDLHVPYAQVAAIAVMAIGVCVAAALPPAYRAARVQPAVALRHE